MTEEVATEQVQVRRYTQNRYTATLYAADFSITSPVVSSKRLIREWAIKQMENVPQLIAYGVHRGVTVTRFSDNDLPSEPRPYSVEWELIERYER